MREPVTRALFGHYISSLTYRLSSIHFVAIIALPLHRCREMGYHHRIFDLLDERLLSKDELHTFLQLLFGKGAFVNAPDPQVDWKGFREIVTRVVKAQGKQWNPSTKKLDYWIDLKQLDKQYGKRGLFKLF